MTFAFNPTSQFLYMKYGMYPREPSYYVEAPRNRIIEKTLQSDGLDFQELTGLRDGWAILKQMDDFVLGFSLDWRFQRAVSTFCDVA